MTTFHSPLSSFLFPLSTFLFIILTSQLFGLTDASNDILHVVYGDGLHAIGFQLIEQLGNALFNVVGNLFATLFLTKRGTKRLRIVLQHLVGILINLEQTSTEVNGDILFHTKSALNVLMFNA